MEKKRISKQETIGIKVRLKEHHMRDFGEYKINLAGESRAKGGKGREKKREKRYKDERREGFGGVYLAFSRAFFPQ